MSEQNKTPIVLAYSGGLDTSFLVPWLKDNYGRPIITVTVDTGGIDAAGAKMDKIFSDAALTNEDHIKVVLDTYRDGRSGYVYANDKPGLGVDIDEEEARKYPCENAVTTWTQTRLVDGTLQTP